MTVGLGGIGASSSPKEQWKPFTMIDSVAIEDVFLMDPNCESVNTETRLLRQIAMQS